MPVSVRISDSELRQRLEDHAYNVPPITDTTRAILIKKLNQLDQQRVSNLPKQGGYSGLDYSSAEEEDIPQPIDNSTRRQEARNGLGAGSGGRRGQIKEEGGAVTSKVTRSSRNNSRAGTPLKDSTIKRNVSLMSHSETEEGSEEDDEEEDIEEEEDEEGSEEEEEVNGVDKVDLAVQTSFMDSPSPNTSRFRGQRLENSNFSTTSKSKGYSTTPTIPIMSPYLRKNINKLGSLNEALSTLPAPKVISSPTTPSNTSPTTQATPRIHSQSFSKDEAGPCSYMIVSSLIMAVAASFFMFLIVQYLSLVPHQAQSAARIPVCAGIRGEQPRTDCVPSSELNQTVELYKQLIKVLPSNKACMEEQVMITKTQALEQLAVPSGLEFWILRNFLDNLLVLLKQNPNWGIMLEEGEVETRMAFVRSSSLFCSLYKLFGRLLLTMWSAVWMILGVVLALIVLVVLVRLGQWRQARIKKREEELFTLVRQSTNFLYQQFQMVARDGKGGPSYLAINHIRDQLIPPQDRVAKAGIWAEVVEYIQKNESRVRQDVQKIFGEDFRVWQWLPEMPWSPVTSPHQGHTPYPSSQSTPITNTSPSSNLWPHVPTTLGVVGWQGGAFPLGKHVATPLAPPTSCLKVRHIFDVSQQQETGWVTGVKEEILRRCSEAAILHIAVDTLSEEGTVYIKTAGMEEAGKVFRCLHGQWYRGQLVTAKYLRLERYHERFPESKPSCTPMRTSK